VPTAITVYRRADNSYLLHPAEGCVPVQAVLADGYRVDEGFYDHMPRIFGKPGTLGMGVEEATRRGVLRFRTSNPPPE